VAGDVTENKEMYLDDGESSLLRHMRLELGDDITWSNDSSDDEEVEESSLLSLLLQMQLARLNRGEVEVLT